MSDATSPNGVRGVSPRHPAARDDADRAHTAAVRSTSFGIASVIVAVLILAGIISTGSGSGSLEYVVFMIAALLFLLPLAILGLVFGFLALSRARAAGISARTAITAIALSGSGAVVGLGVRLWAERF